MTSSPPPPEDLSGEPGPTIPPVPEISAADAAAAPMTPAPKPAPKKPAPRKSAPRKPAAAGSAKKPRAKKTVATTDAAPTPPPPTVPASVAAARFLAEPEPVVEPDIILESELVVEPEPQEEPKPDAAPVLDLDVSADDAVPALVIEGLTKTFGQTTAVDDLSLTVPAGVFYGIVGPNGAGKTTTLAMITGLLRPDSGTITVGGVDLAAHPARAKRKLGILPDRLRTFDRLTGRQLLHYYGVLRGLSSAVVESRTADLARAFDLTDALGRTVSDYSTGMTKKIMLAGAMIHSPQILVLDEPFESVDPVSSTVIIDILTTYVSHGGTVILSSHGMDLIERVCSGVAVIVGGRVLAEGTIDEVRGDASLAERFIELTGGGTDAGGLEWLHTSSD